MTKSSILNLSYVIDVISYVIIALLLCEFN